MKLLLLVALAIPCLYAQSGEHWVSTWATSPQKPFAFPAIRPAAATSAAPPPAAALARPAPPRLAPIPSFNNQTIRMIAHTTIGGRRVRIELSNALSGPLVVSAAHIALRDKESAIVPASDRTLLFGGRPAFRIPAGATEIS